MVWKKPTSSAKVNLLETIPVRSNHVTTEWEGACAVLAFPRFKHARVWHRLLPSHLSPTLHARLEEHGTAVWSLIDGHRTVQEIIEQLATHFNHEASYPSRGATYIMQLQKDGFIRLLSPSTAG